MSLLLAPPASLWHMDSMGCSPAPRELESPRFFGCGQTLILPAAPWWAAPAFVSDWLWKRQIVTKSGLAAVKPPLHKQTLEVDLRVEGGEREQLAKGEVC